MTIHIADCGKNAVYIYNDKTKDTLKLNPTDFIALKIPCLQPDDTIVIEDAHMRTRERKSLAQPFVLDELLALEAKADELNITIKLFPQQSTFNARCWSDAEEKTDEADLKSIHKFITDFPTVFNSLKTFNPVSLEDYRIQSKPSWDDKQRLNDDVNEARNNGYQDDGVREWLDKYLPVIYNLLTQQQRDLLGLKIAWEGQARQCLSSSWNKMRCYTIAATLLNSDGSLRLRSDVGELPHWKFVKENYFSMTPYHQKGGVVASNIKFHFRRCASTFTPPPDRIHWTKEEWQQFRQARNEVDKHIRSIWHVFKKFALYSHNNDEFVPVDKQAEPKTMQLSL